MQTTSSDTIVALATPPGEGAIAVVRISGPAASHIASRLSRREAFQPRQATLATVYDGDEALDQVLVVYFAAPASYTGEDLVEISCHGSPYVVGRLLQLGLHFGARLAEPGEFTQRAFLNGKMDLAQAEAVADLISAGSRTAQQQAMRQLKGQFSSELKALRQRLIDFVALIELELDFAEEDVEFARRSELAELLSGIMAYMAQLRESFELGQAVRAGVPTVICGRPNAGKSTLLNALLRDERALVSDIPGTTRDTIEETFQVRGLTFRLIDTAGIRHTEDTVEAMGVAQTYRKIREASVVVYAYDPREVSAAERDTDIAALDTPATVLALATKSDLHADAADGLAVSAKTGAGLDALLDALYGAVVRDAALLDGSLVTSARHYAALDVAIQALAHALQGLRDGLSGELLSSDLRAALDAIGSITGEISTDDLLGSIFSRFCIGK